MFKPKTIRQTIEPLFVMNFLFGMGVSLKKKPPRLIEYTYTACVLILIGVIGKLTLPYYKEYYIISTYALNQIIFEILIYADLLMICTLAVVNRVNAKVIFNASRIFFFFFFLNFDDKTILKLAS